MPRTKALEIDFVLPKEMSPPQKNRTVKNESLAIFLSVLMKITKLPLISVWSLITEITKQY